MSATTQQVLEHHLKCIGAGDLDGVLGDYTDESVLITQNGVLKGPSEMASLFQGFFEEFSRPGARFEVTTQIVEGETAFIVWTGESQDNVYELGTDTFVVRDGKIVAQSFAAKVVARG